MRRAQGAGRPGLFHARGDVHRAADGGVSAFDAATQRDRAGVDADADLEVHVSSALALLAQVLVVCSGRGQQGQAATHGALGVVFLRLVGAEHGLEPVAGVAHDTAAMCLHHLGQAGQRVAEEFQHVFCVQPRGQLCRAHHVDEDDAHQPQRLRRRACSFGRCSLLRQQRCQPRSHRAQRRIDHRIAEQAAQRLQRLDGSTQLPGFAGHGGVRYQELLLRQACVAARSRCDRCSAMLR